MNLLYYYLFGLSPIFYYQNIYRLTSVLSYHLKILILYKYKVKIIFLPPLSPLSPSSVNFLISLFNLYLEYIFYYYFFF